MTINLARSFKTNAAKYDIIESRNGARREFWINRTDAKEDGDNDTELVFEQYGRGSFVIRNAGGRVGAVMANQRGWEMTIGPICTRHNDIATLGDELGAIEAAARILLPN